MNKYCETCGAIKKDFCCCSTFKLFKTKSESPLGCEIKVPWHDDDLSTLIQENQRLKEQLAEAVVIIERVAGEHFIIDNSTDYEVACEFLRIYRGEK